MICAKVSLRFKPSHNGEEEKVKEEKLSQTTTTLPNKLTLNKMNSAPKGSNLKPSHNGEEEKVKEEKLSQTTTSLPNKAYRNGKLISEGREVTSQEINRFLDK